LEKQKKNIADGVGRTKTTSLQLIFFDGEEAFVNWSSTDSLYGSRHLAAKWEKEMVSNQRRSGSAPNNSNNNGTSNITSNTSVSKLAAIDVFVLLDLMGDPSSTFSNLQSPTGWMWDRLVDIETRLAQQQLLSASKSMRVNVEHEAAYFIPGMPFGNGGIDDDHRPFLERGVPIVHVIATPFPRVWHTLKDNASAVDAETVADLARAFSVLIAEYLGMV